jgi:hypothetical protein
MKAALPQVSKTPEKIASASDGLYNVVVTSGDGTFCVSGGFGRLNLAVGTTGVKGGDNCHLKH